MYQQCPYLARYHCFNQDKSEHKSLDAYSSAWSSELTAYISPQSHPNPHILRCFPLPIHSSSVTDAMLRQEAQQNGNLCMAERLHENDTNLSQQNCLGSQLNRTCKATDPVQDETSALSAPTLLTQPPSGLMIAGGSILPQAAPNSDQLSIQGMQFFAKASPATLGGVLVSSYLLREF